MYNHPNFSPKDRVMLFILQLCILWNFETSYIHTTEEIHNIIHSFVSFGKYKYILNI